MAHTASTDEDKKQLVPLAIIVPPKLSLDVYVYIYICIFNIIYLYNLYGDPERQEDTRSINEHHMQRCQALPAQGIKVEASVLQDTSGDCSTKGLANLQILEEKSEKQRTFAFSLEDA